AGRVPGPGAAREGPRLPARRLPKALAYRPGLEREDHRTALGGREQVAELVVFLVGIGPAQQCLGGDRALARRVEDRLIEQREPVVPHRLLEAADRLAL